MRRFALLLGLFLLCVACTDDAGSHQARQAVASTVPIQALSATGVPEPTSTTIAATPTSAPTDSVTLLPTSTPRPTEIRPACVSSAEAVSHVGEHITVCGVVSGVSYRPDVNGQPTFINFDRPFPNHTFTALVWGDRRSSFNPPPEVRFGEGTTVCVDGLVELYQGTPEIVVDNPSQISAC